MFILTEKNQAAAVRQAQAPETGPEHPVINSMFDL